MLESMQSAQRRMSKMDLFSAVLGMSLVTQPTVPVSRSSPGRSITKTERERRNKIKKIAAKSRRRNRN